MKQILSRILAAKFFELVIIAVIILNSVLIGVETYFTNSTIATIQNIALAIFTVEIALRWIAAPSQRAFFTDGWCLFDLTVVLISFIPESLFADASLVMAIRVLRVFRVVRLFRTATEMKLIIAVLIRSFRSLAFNALFFSIFLYLFAIIGVTLFRLPDPATAEPRTQAALQELARIAPRAPINSPDPYGTLDETLFTLFRILTGEDWTDVRYNLITASELGILPVNPTLITTFHVVWFVLSAFLLLNLVVGAILNNYQVIMEEKRTGSKSA